MTARSPRRVVAAIIERDGRVLIGQRRRGDSHPLKWEFPGGKIEPGESPQEALARELEEELAIQARIGAEMGRATHRYPGRSRVDLIFFEVSEFQGEPVNRNFERILWEARSRLPDYDFLEADTAIVKSLAGG